MHTRPTTPFGRRSLSLAMVASQAAAKEFAAKPDASEAAVHKWRLFRALTEARGPLGVTDRALSVLHALLSFHQETALTLAPDDPQAPEDGRGSAGIVVFVMLAVFDQEEFVALRPRDLNNRVGSV